MARPKKEDALGANAYVGARVPIELKEAMEAKARANGRPLADEVREAFEVHTKGRRAKR